MNKLLCFTISVITIVLLNQCTGNINTIDDEILVVPDTYQGPITVFYDQNKEKGRMEFRNGKHFFYVDSTGIFFTKSKLGDGTVESFYPGEEESNYCTEMSINDYPDEMFRVVGGAYRGFKIKEYNKGSRFLRFSSYNAGKAKFLKNGGWHVSDSIIAKLYLDHL